MLRAGAWPVVLLLVQLWPVALLQARGYRARKVSDGVGVERIFPLHSPFIDHVEVVSQGRVRRSRLYYLRALKGKAARIKPRGRF